MSKLTPERMCPMCGGAWTVAPHRYTPTRPSCRGTKSRTCRAGVSYRRRVTAHSLEVGAAPASQAGCGSQRRESGAYRTAGGAGRGSAVEDDLLRLDPDRDPHVVGAVVGRVAVPVLVL